MLYAIERQDGGVSFMRVLVGDFPDRLAEWEAVHGKCASWREIDESEIPADRTFRSALRADLSYDMDKAREIHAVRLQLASDREVAKNRREDAVSAFGLGGAKTVDDLKAVTLQSAKRQGS